MNGWKTLHSSGIGSALQRRLVTPVGRRLARGRGALEATVGAAVRSALTGPARSMADTAP